MSGNAPRVCGHWRDVPPGFFLRPGDQQCATLIPTLVAEAFETKPAQRHTKHTLRDQTTLDERQFVFAPWLEERIPSEGKSAITAAV
nr:hypothetical protein [Microbacterium galbinum]